MKYIRTKNGVIFPTKANEKDIDDLDINLNAESVTSEYKLPRINNKVKFNVAN